MLVTALIERKRDGGTLTTDEWSRLVHAYARGAIPDYQMAALLMAAFLNGMTRTELTGLTNAMLTSGDRMRFGNGAPPRVDKHSTGGVGDKVSLVLAPLVAACGVAVPMIAGRGLGHTGGTLDKLEAIPGFRTDLSLSDACRQVERIGCVLTGQTPEIAPADRCLYALRDATATVEAVPLIAASIMSKKLIEDLSGLVLDVKCGSGALLPDLEEALELAQTMIALGADHGCPTIALLTAMDRPLGHACGNALETEEAFAALAGDGPADLMAVTYALGEEMLLLAGVERDHAPARRRLERALASGAARDVMGRLIEAQGGNPAVLEDPGVLPQAAAVEVFQSPATGWIAQVEPRTIGRAVTALGGGRRTMEDVIDPAVGFVITAKPGVRVARGEPLASIYAADEAGMAVGREALTRAVSIVEAKPEPPLPLVAQRVTGRGIDVLA